MFVERNLITTADSKITISNVVVYWCFENVDDKNTLVKLTDRAETGTNVSFGKGHWSFDDIKTRLGEEDTKLESINHNNTLLNSRWELYRQPGGYWPSFGFGQCEVIQRGSSKDSSRVNINRRLEYITLS